MCFSHAPWSASNDNKTHLYLFLNFLTGEKFSISENVNLSSFSFSQKDKFSFNIKEFLKFNPITFGGIFLTIFTFYLNFNPEINLLLVNIVGVSLGMLVPGLSLFYS